MGVAGLAAIAGLGLRVQGWKKEGADWPKAGRPVKVRWAQGRGNLAERMVGEPTVFALGTAVGFTRALGKERVERRAEGWFSGMSGGNARFDALAAMPDGKDAAEARNGGTGETRRGSAWPTAWTWGVAPGPGKNARRGPGWGEAASTEPSMEFSEGWEGRMFGGVDLEYAEWGRAEPGEAGWSAAAEAEFDANGVPRHVFLTERSGVASVDLAASREIWKWRLRNSEAPRTGFVRWRGASGPGTGAKAKAAPE